MPHGGEFARSASSLRPFRQAPWCDLAKRSDRRTLPTEHRRHATSVHASRRAVPIARATIPSRHPDGEATLSEHLPPLRLALIAHDHKKDDMVELARANRALLSSCELCATGTTGGRLQQEVGLSVTRMLSGPMGGDLQIGARLAVGELDGVIFLRDPMTPQPHEPDINALVRACDVHDVPCATNLSSAKMLLAHWAQSRSGP